MIPATTSRVPPPVCEKPSPGVRLWDGDITISEASRLERESAYLTNPYEPHAIDLTIFVSCYNEAPLIATTLDTVCAAAHEAGLSFEAIVIDDGSTDDSREVVRNYITSHPSERIILRANRTNKGLAQNYVDGAFLGVGKYYRLICGDNSEPMSTILTVLKAVGTADIIVPYYLSNDRKAVHRRLLSRIFTAVINLISNNRIHYYNGMQVHLRLNVMRWHSNTRGFGFQADLLCLLIDLGFTYREIPVRSVEQRGGRSNALTIRNLISVSHTIFDILTRRISRLVYRKPRVD